VTDLQLTKNSKKQGISIDAVSTSDQRPQLTSRCRGSSESQPCSNAGYWEHITAPYNQSSWTITWMSLFFDSTVEPQILVACSSIGYFSKLWLRIQLHTAMSQEEARMSRAEALWS